jgi:uncharacterized protein (TIGR02246 family)
MALGCGGAWSIFEDNVTDMKRFLFLGLLVFPILLKAQSRMNSKTVNDFVAAINAHDPDKLAVLMTEDHVFIDAHGNEMKGKEQMKKGWEGYLSMFPDYKIEITTMASDGDTVLATGFASGTYKGIKTEGNKNYWRLPAAWKAVVSKGAIKLWQVYCDTKIPFEVMARDESHDDTIPRVTSVGGIFFKSKDPEKLKEWYSKNLGLNTDQYGTNFVWYQGADSTKKGYTQWSPFKETTNYFAPSEKDFMLNYRVHNLEAILEKLRKNGVTITDKVETVEYGKFVHILDLENNKIELWEPIDEAYGKFEGGRTK